MIYRKLKDPVARFLRAWSQSSTAFLTLVEKKKPLIHNHHDQLSELAQTLIKADEVGENRLVAALRQSLSAENQLLDQMFKVGEST